MVPEAPYSLERLIDRYDDLEDAAIKVALLEATLRLFFCRAPEVQRMLGRLLAKATEDVSNQDLHDRALLYYRLLRNSNDLRLVEKIVVTQKALVGASLFSEDDNAAEREELLHEFDSLSTVYGVKSDSFIAPNYQVKFVRMPAEHPLESAAPVVDPGVNAVADQMYGASLTDDPAVPQATEEGAPPPLLAPRSGGDGPPPGILFALLPTPTQPLTPLDVLDHRLDDVADSLPWVQRIAEHLRPAACNAEGESPPSHQPLHASLFLTLWGTRQRTPPGSECIGPHTCTALTTPVSCCVTLQPT